VNAACCLALALALTACGRAAADPGTEPAQARPPPPEETTARITLSDWGIDHPKDIGYLSVGVMHFPDHEHLVVYDVRPKVPLVPDPPQVAARAPSLKKGVFVVSHFDESGQNRLGGYFSAFARRPATADVVIGDAPGGGRALAYTFRHSDPGFSGFWVQMFDFKAAYADRVFLDGRGLGALTFSIRGAAGDESLLLKVADRSWERKEDSLAIGDVSEFLPAGRITTTWQRAWVPLDRLPAELDRGELASLVFLAKSGESTVYLRSLAFSERPGLRVPPPPRRPKVASRPLRKAMWVWETQRFAGDPVEIRELAEFCRTRGVTDVFLQLPYAARREGDVWTIDWEPQRLRPLMRALADAGVRVDALDGAPHYVLDENHGQLVASIRAVGAYNRTVPAAERFLGIRYDNEPYLLRGFSGVNKESILRQYLRFLGTCRAAAHEEGLSFGVDVPFWFDGKDRFFQPVAMVDGKPLSELIIDRVDNLSIMNYRTFAYGPDGTVTHGRDELAHAARRGTDVYIGLETVYLPNETMQEFARLGDGGPSDDPGEAPRLVLDGYDGVKVRVRWLAAKDWPAVGRRVARRADVIVLEKIFEAWVPADKITFQDKTPADLERVMAQSATELLEFPSFSGFSIHSYESYRPWLEGRKPEHVGPLPLPRE
jgi:hypothetical protein